MVFDKLKFWKAEDPMRQPDLDPLQSDNPDPFSQLPSDRLQQSDPFADAPGESFHTLPGQSRYPGGTFSHVQQPIHPADPGSETLEQMQHYSIPEEHERDRDTELILAKLDAVKHALDSIDQRVRKIEQQTEQKRSW